MLVGNADGTTRVLEVTADRGILTSDHRAPSMTWSPDGSRLAVAVEGLGVKVFDGSGVLVGQTPQNIVPYVDEIRWSPVSGLFFAAGSGGAIGEALGIFDSSGAEIALIRIEDPFASAAWTEGGRLTIIDRNGGRFREFLGDGTLGVMATIQWDAAQEDGLPSEWDMATTAWSADGAHVAVWRQPSTGLPPSEEEQQELVLLATSSGAQRRVTTNATVTSARWSED
jgi:hypothetical protein